MSHLPRLLSRLAVLSAALALASAARAGAFANSAHGNQALLPIACGSCHVGHGGLRLKMLPAAENRMCFQCHSDDGARAQARAKELLVGGQDLKNVSADFVKSSRHNLSGVGQGPSATPLRGRMRPLGGVPSALSCSNCHDDHYLVKGSATHPTNQVKQIGNARHGPSPEYQLCYRCHGTSANTGTDIERLFRTSNPSYHPVQAVGRSTDVPSLIQPYTAQSIIACTDCHGSDNANGPRGPHGSAFEPILKAHYRTEDGHTESAYEYALCYRCHSRNTVLGEMSNFRYHKKHVVDEKSPCRACHNSHGSVQYTHLINFDTTYVTPSRGNGKLEFRDLGARRGACSLRCHDEDHDDETYPDD